MTEENDQLIDFFVYCSRLEKELDDPERESWWINRRFAQSIVQAKKFIEELAQASGRQPLAEFCQLHGILLTTARNACLRGDFPGAVKEGREWWVPRNSVWRPASIGRPAFENPSPAAHSQRKRRARKSEK